MLSTTARLSLRQTLQSSWKLTAIRAMITDTLKAQNRIKIINKFKKLVLDENMPVPTSGPTDVLISHEISGQVAMVGDSVI